jgi:hypothetical protein
MNPADHDVPPLATNEHNPYRADGVTVISLSATVLGNAAASAPDHRIDVFEKMPAFAASSENQGLS